MGSVCSRCRSAKTTTATTATAVTTTVIATPSGPSIASRGCYWPIQCTWRGVAAVVAAVGAAWVALRLPGYHKTVLPPVPESELPYVSNKLIVPRMSGLPLYFFCGLFVRLKYLRRLVMWINGYSALGDTLDFPDDGFVWSPMHPHPAFVPETPATIDDVLKTERVDNNGFRYNTILDYHNAYYHGVSPVAVAQNLILSVSHSNAIHNLRAVVEIDSDIVMQQAQESEKRWKAGKPLSVLDGVPIPIKDQFRVLGYHYACGGLEAKQAEFEATVVSRLRRCGAIIFGMTNMSELGLNTSGVNGHPRFGTPKNPYSLSRRTGGSSSGSGAAVAAGLAPVAIGADGGGSIRVPASSCGVVGLKTTTGRVSAWGDHLTGVTVDVCGPLGATPRDCAIVLAAISGEDSHDPVTYGSPALSMLQMNRQDLSGITIGYYPEWFTDSESRVHKPCLNFLGQLQSLGAQIKEIHIPYLNEANIAHSSIIACEISSCMPPPDTPAGGRYLSSTRSIAGLAGELSSRNLLGAARVRSRVLSAWRRVFRDVDVVATPALGDVAPKTPSCMGTFSDELDLATHATIARYMGVVNLTGFPAIAFPIDYCQIGDEVLPVCFQLIGNAWCEDLLLRIAELAAPKLNRQPPQVYYDLLDGLRPPEMPVVISSSSDETTTTTTTTTTDATPTVELMVEDAENKKDK